VKRASIAFVFLILLFPAFLPAGAFALEESVKSQGTGLQDQRLKDAFEKYICSQLGKEKEDVVVSRFAVSGNATIPEGKISVELNRKVDEDRLYGYVQLSATVEVGDNLEKEIRLSGWVDVFGPVVCASRDLKKGGTITESDVTLVRKNITRRNRGALTDLNQAVGQTLKNDLNADDLIRDWMLKKSAVVNKGDIVTIVAEMGGIRITAPGRTLEKGGSGESVKVQNLMSRKNIFAKVVDNSTVRVDF
jgi:flagella basal body P-ring formation protein FlgA